MTQQQERKQALRFFMQKHYTDERLAMLLAHARDGKLNYMSCCCFIGVATADHALRESLPSLAELRQGIKGSHMIHAHQLTGGDEGNHSYQGLAETDDERRRILIPIIRAEMRRREKLRLQASQGVSKTEEVPEIYEMEIGR